MTNVDAPGGSSSDVIYDEAKRLASMGLSIIPLSGKRPVRGLNWKPYQSIPADLPQVRDWFSLRDDLGIGIVLGKVSGNLVVRDFDTPEAYQAWASQYPQLANALPTVRTKRGWHIYVRIPNAKTRNCRDGELRAENNYVVAPPSLHPSGCRYEWVRRFENLDDIPILTLAESGLGVSYVQDKSDHKEVVAVPADDGMNCTRSTTDTTDTTDSTLSHLCLSVVDSLIKDTLPSAFGQRRKQLFMLARKVRAYEIAKQLKLDHRKLLVAWHQKALPNIRTKSFDETRADFIAAYQNIDEKLLEDPVFAATERGQQRPDPAEAALYDEELTRSLVKLCLELSEASPNGVFFLACRKAADALGVADIKSVNRRLNMLVFDGILRVVKKGGPETNLATRYEYIGRSRQVRSDGLNSIDATPE